MAHRSLHLLYTYFLLSLPSLSWFFFLASVRTLETHVATGETHVSSGSSSSGLTGLLKCTNASSVLFRIANCSISRAPRKYYTTLFLTQVFFVRFEQTLRVEQDVRRSQLLFVSPHEF